MENLSLVSTSTPDNDPQHNDEDPFNEGNVSNTLTDHGPTPDQPPESQVDVAEAGKGASNGTDDLMPGNVVVAISLCTTRMVPLSSLIIDPTVHQRAVFDQNYVDELRDKYADWKDTKPLAGFSDANEPSKIWLGDGFYRSAAAHAAGAETILITVQPGGRMAALKCAISSNGTHGLRREPGDILKAYQTAVDNGFCNECDTQQVAKLLDCSKSWARKLTRDARDARNVQTTTQIRQLRAQGLSIRDVADKTKLPPSTVHRLLSVPNQQAAEMEQPTALSRSSDARPHEFAAASVIIDDLPGDDLDGVRQTTAKLKKQNATSGVLKDPSAKDAMHAMIQVRDALSALYRVDCALQKEDVQILLNELRMALDRYSAKIIEEDFQDHGYASGCLIRSRGQFHEGRAA